MMSQKQSKQQHPKKQPVQVSLEKAEEMPIPSSSDLARNIKTRGQLEKEAYEAEQHRLLQLEHESKKKESEQFVSMLKWILILGGGAGLAWLAYFYSPKLLKHGALIVAENAAA